MLKTSEIRARDPFILAENGTYHLYVQSANREGADFAGVEVYTSRDLRAWNPPAPVLVLPPGAGVTDVWAPEVHRHGEAYYLFVTLTFRDTLDEPPPVDAHYWPRMHRRGTWVFRAASPLGPFAPLQDAPHTPPGWMALDGTLFVEDGVPHMVFCHEWAQLVDGTMDVTRLSPDLSRAEGEPAALFKASDAPGAKTDPRDGKVTDGPFFHKSQKTGRLTMIWSTHIPGRGYCTFQTRSQTGRVAGPWGAHEPLFMGDGGHGMLFEDFNGRLLLALHQPNAEPLERMRLFEIRETGAGLGIAAEVET
ncbi:MAG: glycoside hydrolase family 43 protein [Kiritimatiellaeota bacterium]|nr:glycoside hydrolase family 43 protein [Kiritimatiellota bacterium]